MIVHNWTCVFHEDLAKDKRTHCRTVVWPNRGRPAGEERYRYANGTPAFAGRKTAKTAGM